LSHAPSIPDGPLTPEAVRAFMGDPALLPPLSKHLGYELLDFDIEAQWVEAAFFGREEFLNPNGTVQGGIITAFLDEAMSSAAFMASGLRSAVPSIEITTMEVRPLYGGRCTARGQVQRLGRSVGFLEGRLFNADGVVCATATATAAIVPLEG